MKLVLPLIVLALAVALQSSPIAPQRVSAESSRGATGLLVGTCMPYAEKCLHCSDCTQCGHCARDKGKCSVCWSK